MSDIVRLGVVGAGSIAVRGIMPHMAMEDVHDRARMTAVFDPVQERAEAAAARFNIDNLAFVDISYMAAKTGSLCIKFFKPALFNYGYTTFFLLRDINKHFA